MCVLEKHTVHTRFGTRTLSYRDARILVARTSLVAVRGVGDVVVARMCGGFVIDIVDGDLCRSVEHFADIDCESTDRTFRS